MLLSIGVTLGVFLFPWVPLLVLRRPLELFPWAILFHIGSLCFLSAISHQIWSYSLPKLIILTLVSSMIISLVLPRRVLLKRALSWRVIAFAFGAALLCNLDLFVIFGHQGWGIPGGRLWNSQETLIHAPFSNDPIRNVMLTGALIRGDGSPFLANSKLVYQTFWFHLQTLIVAPLRAFWPYDSLYPLVQGVVFSLGLVFTFITVLAAVQLRPTLKRRLGFFLLLLFLVFSHADIYSYIHSMWVNGRGGIEADWSLVPHFFRNYSIKLVQLASPQHLLFLAFQLLYWFSQWRVTKPKMRRVWECSALILGFLVSPPMAVLFFPVIGLVEFVCRRGERLLVITKWGGVLILSFALHWMAIGNPLAVLFRKAVSSVEFFHAGWWHLTIPIVFIGSIGVIGVFLTCLVLNDLRRVHSEHKREQIYILLFGALFVSFAVTSLEIRRHLSMWLALMGSLYLIRWFDWRRFSKVGTVGFSVCGILLHGYFLFCFLGKPSSIDPKIPWKDYFAMNRVIQNQFSGMAIAAATEPVVHGLAHHPVNEVATSFAFGGHVYVHSEMSDEQVELVRRMESTDDVLPYAIRLGYSGVLWGPAEEEIWGERFRTRYVQEKNLLARTGTVSLYRIEDGLLADFKAGKIALPPWSNEAGYFREIAKHLFSKGWLREAVDNFQESLIREPNRIETLIPLARTFIAYRKYGDAIEVLERAKEIDPHRAEISELKLLCFAKQEKWELAKAELDVVQSGAKN